MCRSKHWDQIRSSEYGEPPIVSGSTSNAGLRKSGAEDSGASLAEMLPHPAADSLEPHETTTACRSIQSLGRLLLVHLHPHIQSGQHALSPSCATQTNHHGCPFLPAQGLRPRHSRHPIYEPVFRSIPDSYRCSRRPDRRERGCSQSPKLSSAAEMAHARVLPLLPCLYCGCPVHVLDSI